MSSPRELISQGKLAQAAAVLEADGDHAQAADLYERLWNFSKAAGAAFAAGDPLRALGNALRAEDEKLTTHLVDEIVQSSPDLCLNAALVCQERGNPLLAARLFEAADSPDQAAALYEQAGFLAQAAALLQASGDDQQAMALYRKHLAQSPDDSAALLALGRLHLRYEQNAPAAELLQRASREDHEAAALFVAALMRLGYANAARDALQIFQEQFNGMDCDSVDACLARAPAAKARAEAAATILAGRYALKKLLGSGGMGRVYLAHDLLKQREVALKIFVAPAGPRGRDAYARFMREARATGSLQHPHIISLLDFNEAQGFMVLEYMPRGTLAERIGSALEFGFIRTVMLQIAAGLTTAHQHGIVHRDIKPSNIFFAASGQVKLGDFGVAHLQDEGRTRTGAFIGTLAYMAPEQISGSAITFATDLYALGVMFFQMVTGNLPFAAPDLVEKHLHAPPPLPSATRSDCPLCCDEIISRALAKDPAQRFQSLAEFVELIEKLPPQATTIPAREVSAESQPPKPAAQKMRFTRESVLFAHDALRLFAGHDHELGRQITLAVMPEHPCRAALWKMLRAAARSDENLQRVLAFDPAKNEAILQFAPPFAFSPPPDEMAALRLCRNLAQALTPLHAAGIAHGAIAAQAVRTCDGTHQLQLTDALEQLAITQKGASLPEDIRALLALCWLELTSEPTNSRELLEWAEQQLRRREEATVEVRVQHALERAPGGVAKRP